MPKTGARGVWRLALAVAVAAGVLLTTMAVRAFEPTAMNSVVSVLPLWPGYDKNSQASLPPGLAPEGSAVAIRPGGLLVTAMHVIDRAIEITVRLPDGRELPARVIGSDPDTDLALLAVEADLPVLPVAPEPALGDPTCALGNQFGLGISVSCGVVSGLHRNGVGFNPIEDFVQTDAAINPGASGGALIDAQGRLLGIVSAIFTKGSDANIGVNFAASVALVQRVVDDLAAGGRVRRADSGMLIADLAGAERARLAGARILAVTPGGAAVRAGLAAGDVITAIGRRPVRKATDVSSAFALPRPGERVAVTITRNGKATTVELILPP
jgi:S1-C subfamily serine protease